MGEQRSNRDAFVQELISIGGVLLTAWLMRKVVGQPDFARAFHMRTALTVKRIADNQVKAWEHVATWAANNYQKARM